MATAKKEQKKAVAGAIALAKQIGNLPAAKLWLDYDSEADVLYISLNRPQKATEIVDLDDEGILLRYRGKETGRHYRPRCLAALAPGQDCNDPAVFSIFPRYQQFCATNSLRALKYSVASKEITRLPRS